MTIYHKEKDWRRWTRRSFRFTNNIQSNLP